MEIDFEELEKLLYPDGPPDNEEFQNYIVQLASCGVEKLCRESSHLKEERNQILAETRDLVYQNYKTFIHSADCSQTIFREFSNVEDHLENCIEGLPSLRQSVDEFLVTSRSLAQSRHTTSLTLAKHTQLLEILEVPQLMDTCVRNGYYEDALEIRCYVNRLERKHLDIPVLDSIVNEVKSVTRLMVLHLLLQLRSTLSLPQCLKTVSLLRRLQLFSDAEIKIKFLQTRDSWFMGMIKAIPTDDAYLHISKVVEVSRVHLFDIVTQFRAIFSDHQSQANFTFGDEGQLNEGAIFQGWIVYKVNQFLSMLERDLKRGVGPNLETLLNQCMFFGQSLSRVGADFRNAIIPLFQDACFSWFEGDVRTSNFKFDEALSSFSLLAPTNQLQGAAKHPHLNNEGQAKPRPPLALMEFPPLAHYVNGLVNAFNGLRQCCPLANVLLVVKVVQESFQKVVAALVDLHRMESSGFTSSEQKCFSRMCHLLVSCVTSHVNECLSFLFPVNLLSKVTGLTVAQLNKQKMNEVGSDRLMLPLREFLPQKNEMEGQEAVGTEGQEGSANKEQEEVGTKGQDATRQGITNTTPDEASINGMEDLTTALEDTRITDTQIEDKQQPQPKPEAKLSFYLSESQPIELKKEEKKEESSDDNLVDVNLSEM